MIVFIHPDKITNYLLNLHHPHGEPKARFFFNLGFDLEKPEVFEKSLQEHFLTARRVKETPHVDGVLSVYECALTAPLGARCIRSVWLTNRQNRTRLIPAYPFF